MVICTIRVLHVVPMMFYLLAYFGLLLLSLVEIEVCGCNRILQIYTCKLIGGDELLIAWVNLDWFFPAAVIFPTIGYRSLYLFCTVLLWNIFCTSGFLSLICFLLITWGDQLIIGIHVPYALDKWVYNKKLKFLYKISELSLVVFHISFLLDNFSTHDPSPFFCWVVIRCVIIN